MKAKKYIVILTIILLILLLILLNILLKNKVPKEAIESEFGTGYIPTLSEKLEYIDSSSNYYNIKTIVERFYFALEFEDADSVYNMLDAQYISKENITSENAIKINDIDFEVNEEYYIKNYDIVLEDVYLSEVDFSLDIYIVNGNIVKRNEEITYPFALMVYLDKQNTTFSIYPETEEFKFSEYTVGDSLNIQMEDSIEFKTSNKYFFEIIDEETYVVSMFEEYMDLVLRNKELAYRYLDNQYSSLRFSNLDEYTQYVSDNFRTFYVAKLYQYQIDEYDNYTQYTFIDERGNTYIFKETSVMQYSVILEIYTVDIPQIVEQYAISSDSAKMLINIQKVFNALNFKDYEYVYGKLDNTFKSNNFNTLEKFKLYIEENLFSSMEIYYGSYEVNSDIIMYDITIKNKDNTDDMSISKTFIMKLNDDGNFIMSFNI